MAKILLLDDNDVAGRAMRGILAKGKHDCFVATTADAAWTMLREGVIFDLVFTETKLKGTDGLTFIERLRNDWYLKILPVVVYTHDSDTKLVKRALGLRVQNYLIKPFHDQLIFREIDKALANPWRNLHFEEAKSFCALMELTPETLHAMRRDVMFAYDRAAVTFPSWAEARQNEEVYAQINALTTEAESAGVWAGVDFLRDLQQHAAMGNWQAFKTCREPLEFASKLIYCQLNPAHIPESMETEEAKELAREAAERARWEGYDVEKNGAAFDLPTLCKQVDGLPGCPVIDTVAAAFQMTADGRAASMNQVMDLISTDPGLCTQMLVAANRAEHDDMTAIEDSRAAAGLLGELKLNALGKALPLARETHLDMAPLTWPQYWTFQVAVARVARFICSYLEFEYLSTNAYTAGLIHDIGRLMLLKLHPFCLQAIYKYGREHRMPLAVAEQRYLGCTTRDLGVHFAKTRGLPPDYVSAIRWVEQPDQASEHADLVAMVALARHVVQQSRVGACGETVVPPHASIVTTAAWRVLQQRLFPSFDSKKFEVQAHAFCFTLRAELSGRQVDHRPSHAERAAELV